MIPTMGETWDLRKSKKVDFLIEKKKKKILMDCLLWLWEVYSLFKKWGRRDNGFGGFSFCVVLIF